MVGKMKKISFLFVFLYFITLLFVVACSETGELPVAPVPEIPSITIPSTENTRLVFTSDGGEDTLAFIATTGWSVAIGEFYQFNLSSCIRQQNSLTAQFVSFSLSNLANIFYPPNFYNN